MKKDEKRFLLKLTNTLTSTKESFYPESDSCVNMYVCGVTPYDYSHLGHGRCYVFFDVLYRLLILLGYDVNYCRNFTDIDDKLINKAVQEFNDPEKYIEIASKFIKAFEADMKKLNCVTPKFEPRVTETIDEIIKFIAGLIENKKAYVVGSDVYYSIDSFSDYGKLSKRSMDDLIAGARVGVREDKRNPLDFALWKSAEKGPGWDSPWGFGRPGWHIECSAMADKFLGETIDIHGGGMDLVFPHHENEIAQSEGLHGKEFSKYWVHVAFVQVDKEKMSKSLGNFVTLHQLLEQYDPMVIRYYYLVHHYRNPLEFTKADIESATKAYRKLTKFFSQCKTEESDNLCLDELPIFAKALEALCDDINVAQFIGIIFENFKNLEQDPVQAGLVKLIIQQTLGLSLELLEEPKVEITPEIEKLISDREQARLSKDWALADAIRDKLLDLGVDISDSKLRQK